MEILDISTSVNVIYHCDVCGNDDVFTFDFEDVLKYGNNTIMCRNCQTRYKLSENELKKLKKVAGKEVIAWR